MITASAPGKLVLSGEYAVLDGAPAVSMAVDRRALVRVSSFDGNYHRVTSPGFSRAEGRFTVAGGRVEWLQGADDFGIVDAVIERADLAPDCGLSIELDTRDFAEAGRKVGIGSSAALSVAMLAALGAKEDLFSNALEAHRRFQGGGSGVDVATAVHGGLIEFTRGAVVGLQWPDGLAYRVLWSGVAASTPEKLRKLAAAKQQPSRQRLARAAGRISAAWRSADAVIKEFPAYIDALRRFSVDHDLGIFDAGHGQLVDKAATAGLVYKPCGAGGGDVGILLGRSQEELDEFAAGRSLACELDPHGVRLEQH